MSTPPRAPLARRELRRHGAAAGCISLAALFAGFASGTSPFTIPADIAVSVPSALLVGSFVLGRVRPGAGPWRRMDRALPIAGHASAFPWLVLVAALAGAELASYFHGGPRSDYPTISSGLDALFRYRALKATAWLAWLGGGWYLVRR
ncbi:MAG: hypothetical protein ACRDXC_09700 [Acidimicrobiales bacterium]